ncbi:MAG TPA: PepSY domain-containing protein [Nevskiaceae bacterium]|nr:PepSY domain-containing protein [Nevskiaceae bacterium]
MNLPLLAIPLAAVLGAAQAAPPAPPPAAPVEHMGLREALERNEIVSFKSILDWIEQHYVGKVVEVELEDEDDDLQYEVELLTPNGNVIEFEFDARTGELQAIKGRDVESARRK